MHHNNQGFAFFKKRAVSMRQNYFEIIPYKFGRLTLSLLNNGLPLSGSLFSRLFFGRSIYLCA